jgi:ribosomal-protein-serine acetyltransferase
MSTSAELPSPTAPEVIEGRRVVLRALRSSDAAALVELFRANRERLADSFPGAVAEVADHGRGEAYVAAKIAERTAGNGFWYALFGRGTEMLIGQVQLKNVDWSVQRAELAYLIDRKAEGTGLMREALEALLAVGFHELGLRKIFLRTIVGNARSAAIAGRLGFVHEGTLRQDFKTLSGAIVDLEYFGLLAAEFRGG